MKRVEKKILPEYFKLVECGIKTYDFRLADFDIQPGDVLVLKEWDAGKQAFTGKTLERSVSYVGKTKGDTTWSSEDIDRYGYQIIALQPTGNNNEN